jgi:glycosyltransferase involved in cell wall biosynthesis
VQRRLFKIIERWLIGKCDAVFVVNQSIADWYRERYHGVNPVVIRNIPRIESGRSAVDTRKMLSVPPGKLLFVHVGSLTEGRNIHTILETFASDEVDAHVLFLGDGPFEAAVCDYRRKHSNIHWLPPVSPAEVVSYVAGCDVGLCLSQASCLSYKLSLGNKALEYIKAGLPFFFTDLPEVHRLLGPALSNWCIKDPARCLASAITDLTASKIDQAAADIAKVRLPTWDEEAETMIAAYMGLISGARTPTNR